MLKIIKTAAVLLAVVIIYSMPAAADKIKPSDKIVTYPKGSISLAEFNRFYYFLNKLTLNIKKNEVAPLSKNSLFKDHPVFNKTFFLDQLIVLKMCTSLESGNSAIDKNIIKAAARIGALEYISRYYRLEKIIHTISISDREIEAFYKLHADKFKGMPYNADLKQAIKQQEKNKKIRLKLIHSGKKLLSSQGINQKGFEKYLKKEPLKPSDNLIIVGKINITLQEFHSYFYLINEILYGLKPSEIESIQSFFEVQYHPVLNKIAFMERLIIFKIQAARASKDRSVNKEELKTAREYGEQNYRYLLFLSHKLKKKLFVTEEEIQNHYNENSEYYKSVILDDNLILWIKKLLYEKKFAVESRKYTSGLLKQSTVKRFGEFKKKE